MPNPRTEKQARDVLNQYVARRCKNKYPKPLNVNKFIDFIAEVTKWDIVVEEFDGMEHLRGLILKNTPAKKALIIIGNNFENNDCWKRFTAIKEVSHIFLSLESQIECDDGLVMLQSILDMGRLTSNYVFTESDIKVLAKAVGMELTEEDIQSAVSISNPHGVAEVSGVAAAIEILIPVCYKDQLRKDAVSMNLNQMAARIKVPAYYLEHRLNQWRIPYFN